MGFSKTFSFSLGLFLLLFGVVGFLSPTVDQGLVFSTPTAQAQTSSQSSYSGEYQFLEPLELEGFGGEEGAIDVSSEDSFPNYVNTIIQVIIGIAIALAVIMVIVGGVKYMGSESVTKKGDAKETIGRAVGGLILALASVLILQSINPALIELDNVEPVYVEQGDLVAPEAPSSVAGQVTDNPEAGYCAEINGDFTVLGDILPRLPWDAPSAADDDGYLCYDTRSECEETRNDLLPEFEEVNAQQDGADSVGIGECEFYYQQCGTLRVTDESTGDFLRNETVCGEALKNNEEAGGSCQTRMQKIINGFASGDVIDQNEESAEVEEPCSTKDLQPASESSGFYWNNSIWCSTNKPSVGEVSSASDIPSGCWLESAACSASGGCYEHPTSMAKVGDSDYLTSCEDCSFINQFVFPKDDPVCSGDSDYCRLNSGMLSNLQTLRGSFPPTAEFGYEMTEAFPPQAIHQSECHYDGTCIDVGVRPRSLQNKTNSDMADFLNGFFAAAEEAGMSACYEVGTAEARDALEDAGANPENVLFIEAITAPHFSVYNGGRSC